MVVEVHIRPPVNSVYVQHCTLLAFFQFIFVLQKNVTSAVSTAQR